MKALRVLSGERSLSAGTHVWLLIVCCSFLGAQEPLPEGSYEVDHYDVGQLRKAAEAGEPFELLLVDGAYQVQVEPSILRSDRFRARAVDLDGYRPVIPPLPGLFKGRIVGDPASVVRLSFSSGGLHAFVKSGENVVTLIEPHNLQGTAPGSSKAGRESPHRCISATEAFASFNGTCAAMVREGLAQGPSPAGGDFTEVAQAVENLVLEVAVEADYPYFLVHGTNTAANMEQILNVIEGIYESELGITLEITSMDIFETDSDPYTTTHPNTLLDQFKNTWNAQKGSVPRDVAHLFTGRDLDGSVVGIAYVGQVCSLGWAYGLTMHLPTRESLVPLVTAHELGHNLAAGHDNTTPYIMNATLSGSTQPIFSDLSKGEISGFVAGIGCLDTETGSGGSPPASPSGGGAVDPLVLLGVAILVYRSRRKSWKREGK